jgi:hypothetical protein
MIARINGSDNPIIDVPVITSSGPPIYMVREFVTRYAAPLAISSIPSVTIKEGRFQRIIGRWQYRTNPFRQATDRSQLNTANISTEPQSETELTDR